MIKEFLDPDVKKTIVFIVLLIISFGLNYLDHSLWVLNPLIIFRGVPCPGGTCSGSLGNLIVGTIILIIWYLLSCIIVYLFRRYKK